MIAPAKILACCTLIMSVFSLQISQAQDHQEITFFKIGTGGLDGTYFPMGGVIANAISNPPGTHPCQKGGNCGVPGLIAVAQSTSGSLSNILSLQAGQIDSAFVQADVLYWAYHGQHAFEGRKPKKDLRVLASLFKENIYVVARKELSGTSIDQLRGKKVSLGAKHSDTLLESRLILGAYGLREQDVEASFDSYREAAKKLRAGDLDAFFMVAGTPSKILQELAQDDLMTLLPIEGEQAKALLDEHRFLQRSTIYSKHYENTSDTATLAVPTIWVSTKELDETLVHQMLRALWHEKNRMMLERASEVAANVRYESAFEGVAIPIHDGALRFHEELESLKVQRQITLDQPEKSPFFFSFDAFADTPD